MLAARLPRRPHARCRLTGPARPAPAGVSSCRQSIAEPIRRTWCFPVCGRSACGLSRPDRDVRLPACGSGPGADRRCRRRSWPIAAAAPPGSWCSGTCRGSGFFISPTLLLTNAHVLCAEAAEVRLDKSRHPGPLREDRRRARRGAAADRRGAGRRHTAAAGRRAERPRGRHADGDRRARRGRRARDRGLRSGHAAARRRSGACCTSRPTCRSAPATAADRWSTPADASSPSSASGGSCTASAGRWASRSTTSSTGCRPASAVEGPEWTTRIAEAADAVAPDLERFRGALAARSSSGAHYLPMAAGPGATRARRARVRRRGSRRRAVARPRVGDGPADLRRHAAR